MDVLSDSSLDIRNAADTLRTALLWRYDAVVLTLGANDAMAFTSILVWETRLAGLLAEITALTPPRMELFVIGIQPIRSIPGFDSPMGGVVGRHAEKMNRVSLALCSGLAQVTFVPLAALPQQEGERFRSPDGYTRWGRELAAAIAPVLDAGWLAAASGAGFTPGQTGDTRADARQHAMEDLNLVGRGTDPRLDHVVDVARQVFGTQIALFTVLDNDRQLHIARTGTDLLEIPLADSFCNIAIGFRDGLVIPDARQDARFRNNPLVRGEPMVRFYAGYPIESPNGERIGTLCILDPEPRAAEDVDLSLLKAMARLVEGALSQSNTDLPPWRT